MADSRMREAEKQRRRSFSLFFLFLCLSASLPLCLSVYSEEESVALEYRFTPGQPLHYRHEVLIQGTQGRLEGAPEEALPDSKTFSAKAVSRVTLEPKTVEPDGSTWVDVRYDAFDFSQSVDGKEISGAEGEAAQNAFQGLIGKTVSLKLQKNGRLLEAKDPSSESSHPEMVNQFRQMYGQMEGVFPGHPVSVGESWAKKLEIPVVGITQKVTVDFQNTLESFERIGNRRCAKIKSVLTFSLPEEKILPDASGESSLSLSLKIEGKGSMEQYFDVLEGVVVKGEGSTVTTSIQSMAIPQTDTTAAQSLQSRSTIEMAFKTELE